MNSAPHLQSEDRPEFERLLDDALRAEEIRLALADAPGRPTTEQLRAFAMGATAAIAACAATEYEAYVSARGRRGAGTAPPGSAGGLSAGGLSAGGGAGGGGAMGAGVVAVVAVLAPILAGLSAIVLLCVGYLLRLSDPEPSVAAPLRFTGWLFAGIAVTGVLIGMIMVVATALRNTSSGTGSGAPDSAEVAAARDAWRRALLERGIRPYLHQVLTAEQQRTPLAPANGAGEAVRRTPPLGYSRPGFTSPNPDDPEEPRRGPEFSSPRYTSPHFSSPDFDTGSGRPDTDRA